MARTNSTLCFTDRVVSELLFATDSSKRVEHRDSALPGLVLRIGRRSKTFYLIGTVHGRHIKCKIGQFPGMGVERARVLAETRMRCDVRTNTRSHTSMVHAVENFADVEMLTTKEAALLTKMSMAWYERKRWEGLGPPYYRKGRSVRYVKHELLSWWLACRVSAGDD